MVVNVLTGLLKTADIIFGLGKEGKLDQLTDIISKDEKRNIAYARGNVFRLISDFIIEPVIIISDDLKREDDITSVIKANMALFTSVYSQAMVQLVTLHGMQPVAALDLLSSDSGRMELGFGAESLDGLLVNVSNDDGDLFETLDFTSVSKNKKVNINSRLTGGKKSTTNTKDSDKDDSKDKKKRRDITMKAGLKGNNTDLPLLINTYDLSVEAVDKSGNKITVVLPIIIKAKILYGSEDEVMSMVEYNSERISFSNRLMDAAAGVISISELFTASDLIKEHKKKKLANKTLFTDLMEERLRGALSKVASQGAIGFGMYYQMVIVSDRVRQLIEAKINGKLVKESYKLKLLNQINSMTITVVDSVNKRVSIFANGLSGYSDLSFKQIKKQDKNDDLTDILKAVMTSKML